MSKDHKRPGFSGINTLLIAATSVAIVCVLPFILPLAFADSIFAVEDPYNGDKNESLISEPDLNDKLAIIEDNSLLIVSGSGEFEPEAEIRINVTVTGYSSTVEETDDTPFVTASNTIVRSGIVAANFLPFGAKIRIPEVYGDIVFVVEDRMNARHWRNVDIWFPSHPEAEEFGIRKTYIEIVEN